MGNVRLPTVVKYLRNSHIVIVDIAADVESSAAAAAAAAVSSTDAKHIVIIIIIVRDWCRINSTGSSD